MLIKEICKLCHKKANKWEWNKYDDRYWDAGYVYCPIEDVGYKNADINKNPLDHCIYALEHIVNENKDVK